MTAVIPEGAGPVNPLGYVTDLLFVGLSTFRCN
jgi:hypothetical protein